VAARKGTKRAIGREKIYTGDGQTRHNNRPLSAGNMDNVDNKPAGKKKSSGAGAGADSGSTRRKKPAKKQLRQKSNTATGLVVVVNDASQAVEEIGKEAVPAESGGIRIVGNASKQSVDEIVQTSPSLKRTKKRRPSTGLRIRKNASGQSTQKIKRQPIQVEPDEEIGYKKLFTQFEEAFLGRDMKALGKCLSPSFEWRLPNGDVVYGKEEALVEMERRFAMPNGPKFSKSVWRFKGKTVIQTYRVKYLGPDGKWRKSRGMDLYKIRKSLIARKDAFWKMIP
jgi:hypothetical protein